MDRFVFKLTKDFIASIILYCIIDIRFQMTNYAIRVALGNTD